MGREDNANDGDIDIGDNENDEDDSTSEDNASSSTSMSPNSSFSSDDNIDLQPKKAKVVIPLLPLHQINGSTVQTNTKCESSNVRFRDSLSIYCNDIQKEKEIVSQANENKI